MTAPWAETCQREARRRSYEIAAELTGVGLEGEAECLTVDDREDVKTEERWRSALDRAGLEEYRIEREVRRVRELAEGRLIRESGYRFIETRSPQRREVTAMTPEKRGRAAPGNAWVRVARIRRAR